MVFLVLALVEGFITFNSSVSASRVAPWLEPIVSSTCPSGTSGSETGLGLLATSGLLSFFLGGHESEMEEVDA